jgi:hypothetical protein
VKQLKVKALVTNWSVTLTMGSGKLIATVQAFGFGMGCIVCWAMYSTELNMVAGAETESTAITMTMAVIVIRAQNRLKHNKR